MPLNKETKPNRETHPIPADDDFRTSTYTTTLSHAGQEDLPRAMANRDRLQERVK